MWTSAIDLQACAGWHARVAHHGCLESLSNHWNNRWTSRTLLCNWSNPKSMTTGRVNIKTAAQDRQSVFSNWRNSSTPAIEGVPAQSSHLDRLQCKLRLSTLNIFEYYFTALFTALFCVTSVLLHTTVDTFLMSIGKIHIIFYMKAYQNNNETKQFCQTPLG